MHLDVVLAAVVVLLVPVVLLVVVRRRSPHGQDGIDTAPDKSVLHCAAPPPTSTTRRT